MEVLGFYKKLMNELNNNEIVSWSNCECLGLEWDWWVGTVPCSCIVVPCGWHHDGGHYGGNVKSRPFEHKLIQQLLFIQIHIPPCFQSLLHRDSSWIMQWIRLIPVVVSLDDEPVFFTQFVICVNCVDVSLDDCAFVWVDAWYDVIDWAADSGCFQSSNSLAVWLLLFKNLS